MSFFIEKINDYVRIHSIKKLSFYIGITVLKNYLNHEFNIFRNRFAFFP